jgi:hypothetical protein
MSATVNEPVKVGEMLEAVFYMQSVTSLCSKDYQKTREQRHPLVTEGTLHLQAHKSELLSFWTLSIVQNSKYWKMLSFRNWICI